MTYGSGAGGGKGSVGLRGPGETQLEMDRRIILNRMSFYILARFPELAVGYIQPFHAICIIAVSYTHLDVYKRQ